MRCLVCSALLPIVALAAAGCGEPIDRASDVTTLRVLAVSADQPFARPGSDTRLTMLLHDGSPRAVGPDGTRRPVRVLWMGACVDPAGDLYYNCYPTLHESMGGVTDAVLASEGVPATVPKGTIGFGTSFALPVPPDAISSRTPARQVIHPYGIVYAFYAACGGIIRRLPGSNPDRDLPVGCFDSTTGQALGPGDFDIGYFPIYVYDDLSNLNPGLAAARLGATKAGTPCASASSCEPGQTCGSAGGCIPVVARCDAADPDDCPSMGFVPLVDPSTLEPAITANLTQQDAPLETFWVAYFSTAGRFAEDIRMVYDPGSGWSTSYDGVWRASAPSGTEARLWAVLRDNRNGVAWAWQDVWIE